MVASRIIKICSIAVLATFLISSVEPTCPTNSKSNNNDGKMEKYIIMLKKNDENAVKDHYEMMEECYDRSIKKVKPNSELESKDLKDKNILWDFSVQGVMQGYSGFFTEKVAEELSEMDCVDIVEKNDKVEIKYAIPRSPQRRAVDDDPTFNDDRIDQAKGKNGKFVFPDSAGEGVNIFVVDTGIRATHNEFEDRAKAGGSFCDGCNDDDENGHGTHVASIAGGKTLGVARKANLIGIRVLDANGAGANADVINGLSFVAQEHAKAKNKNTVVNMSLGGGKSAAVNTAVQDLTDAGIHVVVAAGNESQDACNASPASEPTAITVGATEKDNDDITDFSNFGKCVDIFAPGRDIQGAGIQNDNNEVVFSGTSQACPQVAGTVALLIAEDGNKSPAEMQGILNDLSTKDVVGLNEDDSPNRFLRTPEE